MTPPSLFKAIPQSYLRLFLWLKSSTTVCQIKQFSTFQRYHVFLRASLNQQADLEYRTSLLCLRWRGQRSWYFRVKWVCLLLADKIFGNKFLAKGGVGYLWNSAEQYWEDFLLTLDTEWVTLSSESTKKTLLSWKTLSKIGLVNVVEDGLAVFLELSSSAQSFPTVCNHGL